MNYLHEIQPNAAGATATQFHRLVDATLEFARSQNPDYPHTQALIDASIMLETAEHAGLKVCDA